MSRLLALCAFLVLCLAPLAALADVISEEEDVCGGKKAGQACTVGGDDGACVASKCSRNDYSNGPPPTTVQVDCLVCDPAAEPEGAEESPKKAGCSVTTLATPLPLSLVSLAVGAGLLGVLVRRRRRRHEG